MLGWRTGTASAGRGCAAWRSSVLSRIERTDPQRRRGGADRGGFPADALDGPVGVSPVARRHVRRHRGMAMIAAGAQMRGDPLAFEEDLDGVRRQPDLDLAAGE